MMLAPEERVTSMRTWKISRRNQNVLMVLSFVASLSLLAVPGASASANNPPTDPVVVTVNMEVDCANITAEAEAYAIENDINICGLGEDTNRGTVTSNCGTSTILLNRIGGGRTLSVNYGFYSSLGDVIFRNLWVAVGSGGGSVGGWGDVSGMFHYVYNGARLQTFPSGMAYAQLGGTVNLWWGLTCVLGQPTAYMSV